MDALRQDLKQLLRTLARSPGFALLVLAVPALGIGANTAIFTVVDAVLLRPLPYDDPQRVVSVFAASPARGLETTPLSERRFSTLEVTSSSFETLGAYTEDAVVYAGAEEPRQWRALRCSKGLLEVLRVKPWLGRNFSTDEDSRGGTPVAILAYDVWRHELGSDGAIVGKSLPLDGVSHTVIGVLPEGFAFPDAKVDVLLPRIAEPSFLNQAAVERGATYIDVVARLRGGVSLSQARADLELIARRDPRKEFLDADLDYRVIPLQERMTKDARPTLLLLLGASVFVLLIACANVASLLLLRAVERGRETAVRAAMGASRSRLVRQLLTESLFLGLTAGTLGLLLARWLVRAIVAAAGDSIPGSSGLPPDPRVLAVTASAAVLTGLAFGIAPALRAARVDLAGSLKESRGGSPSRTSVRLRGVFVTAEVAVSVVLLVGAGLLLLSLARLRRVDAGFSSRHVLVAKLTLPPSRYGEPSRIRDFYSRLAEDVSRIPGVRSVGSAESVPFDGAGPQTLVAIDGRPLPDLGNRAVVSFDTVSPGYFRAMGIPVLAGRGFTEEDDSRAPTRVVVSRQFERRFFPGESSIGKGVLLGKNPKVYEIVGVVGDARYDSLAAPPSEFFYLSATQRAVASMRLVARTSGEPLSLARELRTTVFSIDPLQPVQSIRTLEEIEASSLGDRRLALLLVGAFALMAFGLSASGLYGVLAYAVSQRTAEIGVRMALGARTGDIVALVLSNGLALTSLGVLAGLWGAASLAGVMSHLLYETRGTDPLVYASVALLLLAVSLAAAFVPARRAAHIDPVVALRRD